MAIPRGFDHFCKAIQDLKDHYVIIGGGAAAILMDSDGLEFRSTRDVDLVLLAHSDELANRILKYTEEGKYKTTEATDGQPRYYRFTTPENKDCPEIIEIFARNELNLKLNEGQYIIPAKRDDKNPLSAILLDDQYFALIKGNVVQIGGKPIINALANICLKARAFRELTERKEEGYDRKIKKHLKDIWKLAVNLTGDEKIELAPQPASDFKFAFEELSKLNQETFKQVMEKTPVKYADIMDILKKVFLTWHEAGKRLRLS